MTTTPRPPPPSIRNGQLTFRRIGLKRTPWRDLYHSVLTASWWGFLAMLGGGYAVVNAVFAGLYLSCGDCIGADDPRSFLQAFAFSVQTISTIGYGSMSPTSPMADVLVAVESFVGLLGVALATGLCFAKFARPDARVAFSEVAVVARRNGRPCLQFRMANERNSRIVDARLSVYALIDDVSEEGVRMRRFHQLHLERHRSPVFLMSWTVMHFMDGDSPLAGADPDRLDSRVAAIVATLAGVEDTYMSTVHAQHYYEPHQIRFNHRFVDIITSEDGIIAIDHTRLDDTVPIDS